MDVLVPYYVVVVLGANFHLQAVLIFMSTYCSPHTQGLKLSCFTCRSKITCLFVFAFKQTKRY